MNGFRRRVLLPLAIPMAAMAVIAVLAFNVSRVLLVLEQQNSAAIATTVAIVAAVAVLGACAYSAARVEVQTMRMTAMATGAIVLLFAGGYGFGVTEEGEGGGHETAAGEAEVAAPGGGMLDVVATDPFTFEPAELTVPAGEVTINLENTGAIVHTFLFEDVADFEKLIVSGTRRTAPGAGPTASGTTELEPGTYIYFCDERGHRGAGMEGTLTVTEPGAAASAAPAAGGGEVEVVATDPFTFEPAELTVPAGEVTIKLENTGAIVHTFLFEDVADFEKLIASGTKRTAPGAGPTASGTTELEPGTYIFYCDERGHRGAGMEGTLTVTEPGAAASAASAPGGGEVDVVATDPFTFEPAELTVPAGEVTINLENTGAIVHTLLFEDVADFEKLIVSGTKRKAPDAGPTASGTTELEPGTYIFYCDERGHRGAGMEGTLTVQ